MLSLNHYFCMTHALYDTETREDIIMRTNGLCWDVGLVAFWWKMCHHEKQREEKWACRRQCAEEGLWHDNICAQPENYSPRISVFLQLVSWLTCGFGGINVWSCIPFLARRKKNIFSSWYHTLIFNYFSRPSEYLHWPWYFDCDSFKHTDQWNPNSI